MLSRDWMEGNKEGDDVSAAFNSLLDAEAANWYAVGGGGAVVEQLLNSSAPCSPASASVFFNYDNQANYFLPPNPIPPNPPVQLGFENGYFGGGLNRDLGFLIGEGFNEFGVQPQLGNLNLSPNSGQFAVQLSQAQGRVGFGELGFGEGSIQGNPFFYNRSKILKPLDNVTSSGSQPTLFQKRVGLKRNIEDISASNLGYMNGEVNQILQRFPPNTGEINEMKRKASRLDGMEGGSIEANNSDSDDQVLRNAGDNKLEESIGNGENSSHDNSTVTGDDAKGKQKKKGHPAKNLLAERRRRKKLNDRLYMLRSVVPKISKMDRASILGDAIEYLKELMQRINDLQNELDSTPSSSSQTPAPSFHPLMPAASGILMGIKEEPNLRAFRSSVSAASQQPASVEVRVREGREVNIHMFCGLRPGLLLSTMMAMDRLGLDIRQAVISCFNGFALDVFRAECKEGEDLNADQIKAALLDSTGSSGIM